MIKLSHDIFITLVLTLCVVTAKARYYPPKSVLRGGNPEVLDILLHGNENPEILTVLSDSGNSAVAATHRDNLKFVADGYSKAVIPIHKESESNNQLFTTTGISKYTIKDKDLKKTFNKIVGTVTKVNDERILNLKKLFELENYLPQVSRTTQQKNPLIAIIMNTPNYKSKYDNRNINHLTEDPQYDIVKKKHKEPSMINILKEIKKGAYFNHNEDDGVNISQESDKTSLTKNYYLRGWKGCNKSASKACQKACKKAFKTMCNDYKCSSSLKKDGKKQCKKRCKDEFINADSDESEE